MPQDDINETYKSDQFRSQNVVPADFKVVEFRSGDPTDLARNPKRVWARTDTGEMKYTVDGININEVANSSDLAGKADQSDLDVTNDNVAANTSAIAANTSAIAANATAITNIGNASPKGTYATLSALQTAFPTGTTGIYVVTADGHWYYWNGTAWTDGGVYQSSGIADGSVTVKKLDSVLQTQIYQIQELLKTYTLATTGSTATSVSLVSNTLTFTTTANGQDARIIRSGANFFEVGKKYKFFTTFSHNFSGTKTFEINSLLSGSVNVSRINGSLVTVPVGNTVNVNFDYTPSVAGDIIIYAYGGNGTVTISIKAFDITNIPVDVLNNIDFSLLSSANNLYIIADYSDRAQNAVYATTAGSVVDPLRNVTCWGDSLTVGYGGGGTTFPNVLASLSGKTVNNMGVSGEATLDIIARQGGYPAIVNPFTIPAGTTAVEITYKASNIGGGNGGVPRLGQLGTTGINPVTIGGIPGSISYSSSKYYFTRTTAGTATDITRPTPVITNSSTTYKNDIEVIFMGTNGGWIKTGAGEEYAIDSLIAQHDMMLNFNKSNRYIVVGMHYYYSWMAANGIVREDVEYALLNKYGRRYINLREYMVNYGLADAGITPTTADTAAIANGDVPPSLLFSDGIHGNSFFYTILGNLVYTRGKELGYW